jgi:GPH family glycoside/pentoside/hexuronide:cation symporter
MASLPPLNRLGYAGTGIGSEALNRTRDLWLLFTYAPPADAGRDELLPLALASGMLFAARLVGALDDLFIGYWSDRTTSRWGRRLPWIVAGTPAWILFGFLVFVPPADGSTAMIALYLFLTLELYNIFSTVASGPFEALFPEVARTNAERLKLSGLRVYFGVAGAAVGLVASGLIKEAGGIAVMAGSMAIFCLIFRVIGVIAVWNHVERDTPPATVSLRQSLRATFSNRQFLYFLPTFVMFGIGLSMLTGLLPYYVSAVFGERYHLQAGPLDVEVGEGAMTSILTAVVIGTMICMVPVFARIALRRSKRAAFSRALLGCSITFPVIAVLGFLPGVPVLAQALVAMVLVGAPIVGVYLFPTPLTADIVDHDADLTGMRREGTYFGAQNFVEKTAGSLAPLLLGGLLLLGNTSDDPLGIRLVGPAAGLITFTGYWVFRRYTLSDDPSAARREGAIA